MPVRAEAYLVLVGKRGFRGRQEIPRAEDYSNFGLTAELMAGAKGIPFIPIMSQKGSSINKIITSLGENKVKHVDCPFTGQKIMLISGINPDVSIIHLSACPYGGQRSNVDVDLFSEVGELGRQDRHRQC